MITGKPTWRAHSMRLGVGGNHAVGARENRHAVLLHGGARLFFFSHQANDFRRRPDELDAAARANFGEVGIFGQQAVAGMDRVHVGDFGGADDGGNIQITQRELRRPDADRFVGEADVQRVAVGFAVNRRPHECPVPCTHR